MESCKCCNKKAVSKCGSCGTAFYCSKGCQKIDWNMNHKYACIKGKHGRTTDNNNNEPEEKKSKSDDVDIDLTVPPVSRESLITLWRDIRYSKYLLKEEEDALPNPLKASPDQFNDILNSLKTYDALVNERRDKFNRIYRKLPRSAGKYGDKEALNRIFKKLAEKDYRKLDEIEEEANEFIAATKQKKEAAKNQRGQQRGQQRAIEKAKEDEVKKVQISTRNALKQWTLKKSVEVLQSKGKPGFDFLKKVDALRMDVSNFKLFRGMSMFQPLLDRFNALKKEYIELTGEGQSPEDYYDEYNVLKEKKHVIKGETIVVGTDVTDITIRDTLYALTKKTVSKHLRNMFIEPGKNGLPLAPHANRDTNLTSKSYLVVMWYLYFMSNTDYESNSIQSNMSDFVGPFGNAFEQLANVKNQTLAQAFYLLCYNYLPTELQKKLKPTLDEQESFRKNKQ